MRYKKLSILSKRKNKVGQLPQSYIESIQKDQLKGKIEIFKFNSENLYMDTILDPQDISKLESIMQKIDKKYNYIINIDTFPNNIIPKIIKNYIDIDDFIIEDLLNTDQRIKFESRKGLVFIVIKTPVEYDLEKIKQDQVIKIYEQMSIIATDNIIFVFQEGIEGDNLDPFRKNINNLKQNSIEFFVYYLIDLCIDRYLAFMEDIEDKLRQVEKKIFSQEKFDIEEIYFLRSNIGIMKRDFINILELVKTLKVSYFSENMKYYTQDLLDHAYKMLDMLNNVDDFTSYLMESYISMINSKFNESVRILTVINTIFVPAIFIASIYGMNFENMPELKWKYGYFFTLFIIFSAILFSLAYFKYKKYI
ncbi:MAG: CorA family divalent cation transporter [bacterium]